MAMNSSIMSTPSLLIRAITEYLSCTVTILLNILFIIAIIRPRALRTPQNILLINSALNLICSCITFLISVTIAIRYSINHSINMELCRIIGYLIYSFCHGTMYSYLLLSINPFLNMFYRSKKSHLSIIFTIIEIILQWLLAFMIPSISLFLNQIDFQIKPRFCSARKPFFMTLGILTGFFVPVIFITIFNLIIYFRINKLRTHEHLSFRKTKSNRLYNRENKTKSKLLRQFATFSFVFVIGWGFFACISIFDINDIVPESIYLITLSFPSVSLLIITLMIIHWNKPVKKSLFSLFNIEPRIKYSTSATTVHFSTPLSFNCN